MLSREERVARYMSHFDETANYKNIHLDWLAQNPNFKLFNDRSPIFETEYDYYKYLYNEKGEIISNKVSFLWYMEALTKKKRQEQKRQFEKQLVESILDIPTETNSWFVTIGFIKDNYRDQLAIECINKFFTYDWVLSCTAVLEFYTDEGWRPHLMMKVDIPAEYKTTRGRREKMTKSIVINYIWKSAGFTRKKILGGKEHVDVKPWAAHHNPYIELDKTEKK